MGMGFEVIAMDTEKGRITENSAKRGAAFAVSRSGKEGNV